MTTEEMQIHELAERAGVSVRTIRYYIEEGLLPDPKYQGKYSYYSPSFLDRLELIRRLKESYLPLREIRAIMTSLTDKEVQARLITSPQPSPKFSTQPKAPQARAKPGSRALEYIDRVMEDQSNYRQKGSVEKINPFTSLEILQKPDSSLDFTDVSKDADIWQRISLAPGVELHLRKPVDLPTQNRVRRLIDFSVTLFKKEP